MSMITTRSTLLLTSLLLGSVSAAHGSGAFDWPQWQGRERNAISQEPGLLQAWPKEGPALAWRITGIGGGDSTPAIAAGRIFVMGTKGGEEALWALAEQDGKTLWSVPLGARPVQGMPQAQDGPGCTPTVDGERLYVLSMAGELSCVQASDGKILWRRSLQKDFGAQALTWSYRESPLVDGNKVLCTPGAPGATVVAFDKLTGETIWKSAVTGNPRPAYASAIAIDFGGQRQYVHFTAKALIGVAAADGKFLWQYTRVANGPGINCSTPIYHDGHVLAASAYGAGGAWLKLKKDAAGEFDAEEVWLSKKMQNQHGGMIVHNGAVFGANGGNEGGSLVCLELSSGKVLWDERDHPERKVTKGSIALAGGRLYYRTESGTVLLLEPNSKEYTERGRFDQPSRTTKPAWAHPVIANGKLYIRDHDLLLCYDVKRPGGA
jgi:outer membrane protein assembly factor BamB